MTPPKSTAESLEVARREAPATASASSPGAPSPDAPGPDAESPDAAPPEEAALDAELPSGRRLTVQLEGADEALEIRSPSGALELRLKLTPEGPVLSLSGAKLELAATELALDADRIRLRSRGELDIVSGEEMRLRSAHDMRLNGEMIYIN